MYTFLVLIFFIRLSPVISLTFDVNVNTGTPVRSVPDKFLSISFDTSNADSPDWNGLNFRYDLAYYLCFLFLKFIKFNKIYDKTVENTVQGES